ncbi:MAG TPA: hypothetical protein VGB83_01495 [Actinomycetota bacterium]
MRLPDRLFVGVPRAVGAAPPSTPHVEFGGYADLPTPRDIGAGVGRDQTCTIEAWHVLTHRRSDPRYRAMTDPPPEHAAVGHFDRSRWTDEAWEALDRLARATDLQAVVLKTPASFKASAEHATRLENFVAHAMRPGLALAWEWAPRSWPATKALDLCDRIGAIAVVDPTKEPIPDGELVYLRVRPNARGKRVLKDDELKKVALEVRDRIGWLIFDNGDGEQDAERILEML